MDSYKSASYKDVLQIDGTFAVTHFNYNNTPIFNGKNATSMVSTEIKDRIGKNIDFPNIPSSMSEFKGTLKDYDNLDRLKLWESYWLKTNSC